MKNALLLTLTLIAFLLFAGRGLAQAPHADSVRSSSDSARLRHDSAKLTDTAKSAAANAGSTQDDDMDMFLLFYGIAFICIAFGAVFVGAAVLVGFLAVLFLLVSAGVFSTSVLMGMYRRSVAAGFRTLLMIICGLAGLFTGAVGLWLVGRIFHLHWKPQTALVTGAFGGLVGGVVLGLVLFFIFNTFFRYCRRRLAF
ncbi:MAG TPA: hypothetical protein VGS79_21440 [Puia sp.]|nr:hypothetical protein [Puia sp.]